MRILVVDDDMQILTVAERILKRAGHLVTLAPGPSEAFAALAVSGAHFDVILCDMNMPRMTGVEFAARLSPLDAARVIFTTGLGNQLGSGVPPSRRMLLKPFTSVELVWMVETRRDQLN